MKLHIIAACIAVIFFSGCIERAYYLNPGYGNAMPYHTLPLHGDSTKSNLYVNGSAMVGNSNYDLRDNQYALNANIYNANNFSVFKAWYGGGLTLGDYIVKKYDSLTHLAADINDKAGGKFYGTVNANGGLAITIPIGKSEWRVAGVQATLQQEFGSYSSFRKELLKDSAAVDGNITNKALCTIGLSTEFSIKTHNGAFNILNQLNILTGKNYKYADYDDATDITNPFSYPKLYRYNYFTNVLALTDNNVTAYLQLNTGKRMENIQIGFNYKLIPHRKK